MHKPSRRFWRLFYRLPASVQQEARLNFAILVENPLYPDLRFKKVGKFWSVRIGQNYRALAVPIVGGYRWVWIGGHDEYERIINS